MTLVAVVVLWKIRKMKVNESKPFSKELHKKYDTKGKRAIKKYFEKNYGVIVKTNPDKYGVDLIMYLDNEVVGLIEVEVRASWASDTFPFETLNVPLRKKKLLINPFPTFFASVNANSTRAFICQAQRVLESPLIENPNKYVAEGEMFYSIPIGNITLVSLN